MCMTLRNVKSICFEDGDLKIRPLQDRELNNAFWQSATEAIIDGDCEYTAEQVVKFSPAIAIELIAQLAIHLNKQPELPLMEYTQYQRDCVDLILQNVVTENE